MRTSKDNPVRMAVFENKGRRFNVALIGTAGPLLDAYKKVDIFNEENGTKAKLLSGRGARAVLVNNKCMEMLFTFELPDWLNRRPRLSTIMPPFLVDRLVAFGEANVPLDDSIVYSPGSNKVVVQTGRHKGKMNVCLYVSGLSANDFKVSDDQMIVDIDPRRFSASEHFPSSSVDLAPMHPVSGLPFGLDFLDVMYGSVKLRIGSHDSPLEIAGDGLSINAKFAETTRTVTLGRERGNSYIGNICRGIVCVGLAGAFNKFHLMMHFSPNTKNLAVLVELPEEDIKRIHTSGTGGYKFAGMDQYQEGVAIMRLEADYLTPGWFEPNGTGRKEFLKKLGL